MGPIFESIRIALHSIWTNKLRSFLTVLGNIVAVTSIVTVVSLIQGLNSTVSGAIVGRVGASPAFARSDDVDDRGTLPLDEHREIRETARLGSRRRRGVGGGGCPGDGGRQDAGGGGVGWTGALRDAHSRRLL